MGTAQRWRMKGLAWALATVAGGVLISGCSVVSRVTGHHGWESFTFKAQLPENVGISVQPVYLAIDPSKCQARSIATGQNFTRSFGTDTKSPPTDHPQNVSVRIPLTYRMGLCALELAYVDLNITGRYGPQEWQTSYGRGHLRVTETLPPGARDFDGDKLAIQGECHWLFQQSSARSRVGEIEKMLRCRNAFAFIKLDGLSGKTVSLAVTVNPEERPSHRDTWIKFPNGWKPCSAEGNWSWCKKPPTFQTFKLNGKTCSIYPRCTEEKQ